MAQWTGQFGGFTHETKVQDVEKSLRVSIGALKAASKDEHPIKLKSVQQLAEKLRSARLKAVRARISALMEPGTKHGESEKIALPLKAHQHKLETQSIAEILEEFGVAKL